MFLWVFGCLSLAVSERLLFKVNQPLTVNLCLSLPDTQMNGSVALAEEATPTIN